MHFSFPFTVSQVLWTLTFAAQLVLLVVLLGRDRIKRFPWFTASIVIFALRLLVEVLLSGRLPVMTLRATYSTLANVAALVGLLVVIEVARHAFKGATRRSWVLVLWTVALLAVAGGVLAAWGPWPGWKNLAWNSQPAVLGLMQLLAQKSNMLMDMLTVEVGLLVVLFGRRFKAGWRSHTQQIAIGLSTASLAWLAVQGTWQIIATRVHPHTEAEYAHIMGLGGKLVNANKVVSIVVLVWWIVCLWIEEPGAASVEAVAPAKAVKAE